ncbi:MAG TPA: IS21 family transposase [Legionellaceae bacterium]|nr:IS21 family transposase [Legionellaceae bacterium]
MKKIYEVLRQHYELKHSNRVIGRSLNISPGTVSNYLNLSKVAGVSWEEAQKLSEQELRNRLFLPVDTKLTNRVHPNWEIVHTELRRSGMTLMLLWREYRESHTNGIGYSQFCEHYQRYFKQISPVMRQVHLAGEKTFVDYAGMTVPWLESTTGKIYEAQIFVGCLGASQYTFIDVTATQSIADWISSHIRMWTYFGGVSCIVVPDNLKAGVTKAHRYDLDINANYQLLGEHYGCAIVPARIGKPKDKAKVENAVGCIERQILAPLRNITFTSLAAIRAAIQPRLEAFNQQVFQKMQTSRHILLETLDKPALKPLPQTPYQYADWKKAKVNIDYHIMFDDRYYSVPWRYIHQLIDIRATTSTIECFYEGKRVALHQRHKARYQYSTCVEHMPKKHQAQGQWTPERLRRWASKTGHYTALFIEQMIASRPFPEQAFRASLGVLRLGDRFGSERLEKACAIGLQTGMTRYKSIELILKNNMDKLENHNRTSSSSSSTHINLRGSNYYQ